MVALGACSGILGLTDPTRDDSIGDEDAGDFGGDDGGPFGDGRAGDGAPITCDGIDTTIDSANCGACNHDCLGGDCVDSKCQPVLVAENQFTFDMAVDDTNVYWADYGNGYIGMCPKEGCPNPDAPTLLNSTALTAATSVAVDGAGNVYWTDAGNTSTADGAIYACSIANCPSTLHQVKGGLKQPNDLLITGSKLYVAEEGLDTSSYANGAISVCDLPCTGVFTVLLPNLQLPYYLTGDTSHVYWSYANDATSKYGIGRFDVGTASATLIPANDPSGVAVTSTTFFWTEFSDGNVRSLPLAGFASAPDAGAGTPIITGLADPLRVLADGTSLYVVEEGTDPKNSSNDGEIIRCPVTGCTTHEVIAGPLAWPHAIAVDADSIYYAEFGGSGQVWRLAK